MNTFGDLKDAVKRYLTSNVTLINLAQGTPENEADLMAQVDIAIMQAANSARKYAEKLHDFTECEGSGRAYLTNGSPFNLKRCVVGQSYADLVGESFGPIVSLKSSPTDWPILELNNYYVTVSGVGLAYLENPITFSSLWSVGLTNGKVDLQNAEHRVYFDGTHWNIVDLTVPVVLWTSSSTAEYPWLIPGGAHDNSSNAHAWKPEADVLGTPSLSQVVVDFSRLESLKFTGEFTGLTAEQRYAIIDVKSGTNTTQVWFGAPAGVELQYDTGATVTGILADLRELRTATTGYYTTSLAIKPQPIKVRKKRNILLEHFQQRWFDDNEVQAVKNFGSDHQLTLYQNFGSLYPAGTEDHVVLDGSFWLPNYTQDSDTDFILEHGFDFMTWQTVIDVNHLLQKFIPRQEGTMAPPTKSRDEALGALILNDSTRFDGNLLDELE